METSLFASWFGLALIALFLLLVGLPMLALTLFERTRVAGLVLGGVVVFGIIMVGGLVLLTGYARSGVPATVATMTRRTEFVATPGSRVEQMLVQAEADYSKSQLSVPATPGAAAELPSQPLLPESPLPEASHSYVPPSYRPAPEVHASSGYDSSGASAPKRVMPHFWGFALLIALSAGYLFSSEAIRRRVLQGVAALGLAGGLAACLFYFASPLPQQDMTFSSFKPQPKTPAESSVHSADAGVGDSRPAWVDETSGLRGNVYRKIESSGLFVTRLECQRALDDKLKNALRSYLDDDFGAGAAKLLSLDPQFVRRFVQTDEFAESKKASFGDMQQVYALLEFTPAVRAQLEALLHESLAAARLKHVAVGALLLLTVIGAAFGYLKIDFLTAGRFRPRLQAAAAATILLAAGMALAVRWSASL